MIIAYLAFGVGEDENNNDNHDGETNNITPNANIQTDTTQYPVTIIIIDDFSEPLKAVVDRIDETRADDFRTASEDIRAARHAIKVTMAPPCAADIIERVAPLKEQLAEIVLKICRKK